ncbi:MAG: DNA protecting protein DprA [Armatimonadetes bacterium CG2_30_59_28]|nr:DNA-protecting protein DprA [Armatimonadota bacterium]OIO94674.1 MAG: DNA protecting protein DprA [Armatimonadetes bacterium CG2_30_59_28]PIU67312.1 MAG: DNA-protecting protein DprA [Armatimonadetes bacterium CG07_land_8_20_14_0_80_59_28]PIX39748.1 MAG: DNA-protecting protein DprA [Armatimonadetes bacterium CG_4_8_14_3_um_filter_58_9]PIY37244.1 MAG: DNA-protecting protein DprA [Armatimonadetes bacterium CG_4_10_14_3_um_filter_59_10]
MGNSWLQFNKLNLSPRKQRALLLRFGSPAEVLRAPQSDLLRVEGVTRENVDAIREVAAKTDWNNELSLMEKLGIRMVTWDDSSYPQQLKEIHDPPPLLFVRGELKSDEFRSVAIVGTRRASTYARIISERLAADLSRYGVTVVSGLALGVDTEAHRGALRAGGRTIAVCGCGLEANYPAANSKLREEIVTRGALLSELPFGTTPEKWHFPARNRIISGLSLGVVVVEAPDASGALITADCALEQGREVFAVPGNVTLNNNRGGHRLLKEGATLVEDANDILRALGLEEEQTSLNFGEEKEPQEAANLSPNETAVLRGLGREEKHVDDITRAVKLTPAEVNASLMMLEMKGYARRLPGNMFMRVR